MLLAVRPGAQGTGVGRALVAHVAENSSGEVLAGTIETSNKRSIEISLDAGFKPVAELEVRTFTRLRPSLQPAFRNAVADELPQVTENLHAQAHGWFSPEQLRADELLVTPDLTAGIQLCIHTWRIANLGLPTPIDAVARKVLPISGIKPSHFRFATGHYWWGDPSRWSALLEHALVLWKLQGIVVTGDIKSQLWQDFRRHVSFGGVGSAMGSDGMIVTSNQPLTAPIHFTPLNAV